jgi:hypothetical protein
VRARDGFVFIGLLIHRVPEEQKSNPNRWEPTTSIQARLWKL